MPAHSPGGSAMPGKPRGNAVGHRRDALISRESMRSLQTTLCADAIERKEKPLAMRYALSVASMFAAPVERVARAHQEYQPKESGFRAPTGRF